VPAGRLERLARIGWVAGEMALGGAAEGLRRVSGRRPQAGSALLSGANGRRLARRLSSMRGAAMKLGQLLSLEAEDLLPPEVAEALSVLRDAGDAMPPTQLRRVLGGTWGRGWEQRFRRFDDEPIAAASIGQVHEAETLDGRCLALKIQYPGVARSVDADVDNLAAALRLARILPSHVDFSPLLAEAKRQLRREADYRLEAASLRRYRELIADEPRLVVPQVHDDLSSARILAMDRLWGVPLEDLRGDDHDQAARDAAAEQLLRLLLREFFEFRFAQTDPNFANYLLLPDGRIGLLALGAAHEIPVELSRDYARLFRAAVDDDRSALRDAARDIGFVGEEDGEAQVEALLDLVLLATEPFRQRGVYDFRASDLPARARAASVDLVFDHGFWRPPPSATLFLQRKLGGTMLLCVRIGARVDAHRLFEDAVSGAPKGSATAA
jgi:predicted unusual protein kinase regulating ubiquinone biosynthesis (AarF/ABC1/UbiB family)